MSTVTRCTRCNKAESDIQKMIEVDGHLYGPECAKIATETMKMTGLKGEELVSRIQSDYKEEMRQKTILGMIKKGMFPGINTVEEFDAKKAQEAADKQAAKDERVAKREAKKTAPVAVDLSPTPEPQQVPVKPKKSRRKVRR